MTVVAIPVRFGTDRFGKVSGGVLDSDGKSYPQPAADPEWMGGTTMLLSPAEADPAAAVNGFRPNALLSGSHQQLYGEALDGWVYCDPSGFRWLIRLTLPGDLDITDNAISVPYSVVRFGQLALAPIPSYPSASGTLSLADIGQSPLTLAQTGGGLPAEATWQHTDCVVTLVSIDSTGTNAILCIWSDGYEAFAALSPYGLAAYPQGFLKVACTPAATPGDPPSLVLSVVKTLAQTVGAKYCTNNTTTSPYGYCEAINDGSMVTYVEYVTRSIDLTSGITGILAALYYHEDDLVEMTIDATKVETGEVAEPDTVGCSTPEIEFTQVATRSTVYTLTIKRAGVAIATATATAGLTITSSYEWPQPPGYVLQYRQQTSMTVTIGEDSVTGSTDKTLNDTRWPYQLTASGVTTSGCGWFTFNRRFYNDDFLQTYTVPGEGTFTPTVRRYAYNLLGLAAVKNVDLETKALDLIGKVVSPAGTVAAAAVGTGRYGAYNARTEEAVAGEASPVSYV